MAYYFETKEDLYEFIRNNNINRNAEDIRFFNCGKDFSDLVHEVTGSFKENISINNNNDFLKYKNIGMKVIDFINRYGNKDVVFDNENVINEILDNCANEPSNSNPIDLCLNCTDKNCNLCCKENINPSDDETFNEIRELLTNLLGDNFVNLK